MAGRLMRVWRLNMLQRLLVGFVLLCACAFVYVLLSLNSTSMRGFPADLGLPRRQTDMRRVKDLENKTPISAEPPPVTYTCPHDVETLPRNTATAFSTDQLSKTDAQVLLWLDSMYSDTSRALIHMLDGLKFKYKIEMFGRLMPALTTVHGRGHYAVIIVENYYRYINMDEWNRGIVDKYCTQFGVGLIGFMSPRPDKEYRRARMKGHSMDIIQHRRVQSAKFDHNCSLCHTARAGAGYRHETLANENWLLFDSAHRTFEPVVTVEYDSDSSTPSLAYAVVLDSGQADGIQRVLFGCPLGFWMAAISFVDAIRHLSAGRLQLPLTRYVQIDIDDIFVGAAGSRMKEADVKELLARQRLLRERYVQDFRFSLGFSGKFFRNGNDEEKRADELLIESADDFVWFPHMWRHQQAHQWNTTQLVRLALLNQQFANNYRLPVDWHYAVAPHHSGVYPIHDPLYDMWKQIWQVRVTSTEEYPHLRPDTRRRGFIYRDVMVLPRQMCGLFTHTLRLHAYPNGPQRLLSSIFGGDLFMTFLLNPFLVFMTHWQNYGHDRLALFTFESEFKFLKCWTNLELKWIPPVELAEQYFRTYDDERRPVWTNPCLDKRHMQIWSGEPTCSQLPSFVILGPQKTVMSSSCIGRSTCGTRVHVRQFSRRSDIM